MLMDRRLMTCVMTMTLVCSIAQPHLTLTNPNSVTSETKPGLSSQISLQPAEVKPESHSPDTQSRERRYPGRER